MKSNLSFILALVACQASMNAESPDSWAAEPTAAIAIRKHPVIPASDLFEVVASMRSNAETELKKTPIIPLSEAQARKLTGAYYSCPKGKHPYLVRALFGFAGNGKFWVYKIGGEIWVLHESIGTDAAPSRTALIVNLDFQPTHAYVSASIIK